MNKAIKKLTLTILFIATTLFLSACMLSQNGNESSEIASSIARTKLLDSSLTSMLDEWIGSKSYHLSVSAVLNQTESVEESVQFQPLKVTGKTKKYRSTNKNTPTVKKLYTKNKGKLPGLAKSLKQNSTVKTMPGFPNFNKTTKKSKRKQPQSNTVKETITDTKTEENVYYNEKRTHTVHSSNNIKRLKVTIFLDESVFNLLEMDMPTFKAMVESATGISTAEGDQLNIYFKDFNVLFNFQKLLLKYKTSSSFILFVAYLIAFGAAFAVLLSVFNSVDKKRKAKIRGLEKELQNERQKQRLEELQQKKVTLMDFAKTNPEKFAELTQTWIDSYEKQIKKSEQ
jgi:flagellar biosynthesis/type III secretory pathway M-ring protein FliF/YscJ